MRWYADTDLAWSGEAIGENAETFWKDRWLDEHGSTRYSYTQNEQAKQQQRNRESEQPLCQTCNKTGMIHIESDGGQPTVKPVAPVDNIHEGTSHTRKGHVTGPVVYCSRFQVKSGVEGADLDNGLRIE